jgi:hypothetical protein
VFKYRYAEYTAHDAEVLASALQGIMEKYENKLPHTTRWDSHELAYHAFDKCAKVAQKKCGDALNFPLHYLWVAAESEKKDEWRRHKKCVEPYRQDQTRPRYRQNGAPVGRGTLASASAYSPPCDPEAQVIARQLIRLMEREIPHATEWFSHAMGLPVSVSAATLTRVHLAALEWKEKLELHEQMACGDPRLTLP